MKNYAQLILYFLRHFSLFPFSANIFYISPNLFYVNMNQPSSFTYSLEYSCIKGRKFSSTFFAFCIFHIYLRGGNCNLAICRFSMQQKYSRKWENVKNFSPYIYEFFFYLYWIYWKCKKKFLHQIKYLASCLGRLGNGVFIFFLWAKGMFIELVP